MILFEKKLEQTIAEIKKYIEDPDQKKFYYTDSIEDTEKKLQDSKIRKSIGMGFEGITYWFALNHIYNSLTQKDNSDKDTYISYGYYSFMTKYLLSKPYLKKNPPTLPFDEVGMILANVISNKWYSEGKQLLEAINTGLENEFLDGGMTEKPAYWFIIQIANLGYGIEIDYSKYNYPDEMGIYGTVLEQWNTTDPDVVDRLTTELCDHHLEHARQGDEDTEDTFLIQFPDKTQYVHAYEILNWLSIREMVGLKNPEKFSHPMMDLPINKLPEQVNPMPRNEYFEQIAARLKQEFPEIEFAV